MLEKIKNWAAHWIESHKKQIIIAVVFLVLGMMISPRPTEIIEKEVLKETIKTEIQYTGECKDLVEKNNQTISNFKKQNSLRQKIMDLDNEIIALSSEGHRYCSNAFDALSKFDFDTATYWGQKTIELTSQVNKLGDQKHNLLEELKKLLFE